MKRKDIVAKLIKEGLSEKTLVAMSDKQLNMLAERFLIEQAPQPSIPNVSKTDTNMITTLKQQKKPFATYEGKEIGEEIAEPKLGVKTEPKSTSDKAAIIKRLKYKIEHEKDEKKVADAKKLLDKLTEKKKEVAEGEFKSKSEWLKSKGIIKDEDKSDDKEETKESSHVADSEPENKKEGKKKNGSTKGEGGSEYEKRLSKGNLGFGLNEWVGEMVGKNVHPFTSKNEIMELIQIKLTEQRPQEAPRPAEPDIETKPGRRDAPGIDPDDPFRDPHPGIDPGPKAKKKVKISAEDAKNKIIDLLKSDL